MSPAQMLEQARRARTLATEARDIADRLILLAPGSRALQSLVTGAGVGHAAACNAVRALERDQ